MVFDSNGVPLTTAAPSFTIYRTRALVNLSAPLIFHRGGGIYVAQPSDSDITTGVAYSIDTGAFPSRISGAVCSPLSPFDVLEFVDGNDSLWVGTAPTLGIYKDLSGSDRTPPSLVEIEPNSIYTVTPTEADLTVGVIYRVDAASNSYPAYYNGSFAKILGGSGAGSALNTGFN